MTDLVDVGIDNDPPARKPLILLVEDRPDALRKRRELFETYACTAVAVGSKSEAIRELRHTPQVDLVVTDIHMPESPADTEDRSGIELANYVRDHYSRIPVAGYSAYFEDEQMSSEDLQPFEVVFAKHGVRSKALSIQIETFVRLATAARDKRLAEVEERLDDLRRTYELGRSHVEVVRRLALDPDDQGSLVEGPLGEAGYRLRLIHASESGLAEPIVVWVDQSGIETYCEVYGYPDLFAVGSSESEAIDNLAEYMSLLAAELQSFGAEDLPAHLRRVYGFVSRMFGPESHK